MEKPKVKCAEIYHLNSHLEIICTICSETYERIHNFCSHLMKEHYFDLQNDDLGHFLEHTKILDYPMFPLEVELNDNKNDLQLENNINFEKVDCEVGMNQEVLDNIDMEHSVESEYPGFNANRVYLKRNSHLHAENKPSFRKLDSEINSVCLKYLPSNSKKPNTDVDTLERNHCQSLSKSFCKKNVTLQSKNKEKNSKSESLVELECGNFFCTICGNKITKKNVKKHDHSRYKHQCNFCYKLFISDISLSLHHRHYHKEENAIEKILCEACGESIPRCKLNYHLKLHDDSRYLFQCDICKKKFVSQNRLKNHIKVIHTKKFTSNKYKWIKKK